MHECFLLVLHGWEDHVNHLGSGGRGTPVGCVLPREASPIIPEPQASKSVAISFPTLSNGPLMTAAQV